MELVATKNVSVPDSRGRLSRSVAGGGSGGGAGPGGGGPFQRHDVREWSHMDKLTGMLERARVETGHWAANTKDASHKYGKVVDSRARSAADGNVQQRQHKQLEVFQSRSATGGSLQVIRTQTRTSSRWSSNSTTTSSSLFGGNSALKSKKGTTSVPAIKDTDDGFENLQLSINPLDLTSQKSRASVGRSGSISTRRPPSRPRSIVDKTFNEATDDLSKLSHISSDNTANKISSNLTSRLSTSSNDNEENNDTVDENDRFKELTHNSSIYNNEKYTLTRTKSNSSDDINCVPERETLNDDDSIDWKRTSVIRRSFQFPRQTKYVPISRLTDLPDLKGTVSKIKQDLETGKRLNTAFRGNNVDLYAIDQILKTISPTTSISSDLINKHVEIPERDTQIAPKPLKVDPSKHTFITAQSLQEVRSKLRHLNSSLSEEVEKEKSDDTDDGIVAEDTTLKIDEDAINMDEHKQSNLRPYIFGMEVMSRKPVNGTGSLESNKSNKNCNVSRTEDWYNRRKSYGFEQVSSQEVEQSSYISFREKNKVESSTDSGICRSSETVTPSMKIGLGLKNSDILDSHKISKYFTPSSEIKEHVEEFDSRKKTFVELTNKWNKRTSINSVSNDDKNVNVSTPVTITIPVTNKDSWESSNGLKKSGFEACWKNKIILGNTDISTRLETKWPITATEKQEQKRHSIAADEYNYLKNTVFETKKNISDNNVKNELSSTTSTHLVPVEEDSQQNKRNKKVEFCKTEVHFAAESGKVNIVETDEKPPPTQNFRRRRRNSGGALASSLENINKNINLPLMHFGDVLLDKKLFGVNENSENNENKAKTMESDTKPERHISSTLLTTESENIDKYGLDNDSQLRGILKSAPIKPKLKAYHLGEDPSSSNIWGVRLRPVLKSNNQLLDSLIMSKSINEANETEIKSISTGFQSVLRLSNITEDENVSSSTLEEKPVSMRRSSWSVADRVKQVENLQWSETNGYSTRVNIGENDDEVNDIEISKDNNKIIEESKPINDEYGFSNIINKALVVRIGNDHLSSDSFKNDYVGKETQHSNDTLKFPMFNTIKLPRATIHSLKSTSLIMNTIHKPVTENKILNSPLAKSYSYQKTENENIKRNRFQTFVKKSDIDIKNETNYEKHNVSLNDILEDLSSFRSPSSGSESFNSDRNEYFRKSDSFRTNTYNVIKKKDNAQILNNVPNKYQSQKHVQHNSVIQLATLKKLYEDAGEQSEDSELADEEVRSYMSPRAIVEQINLKEDEDKSSVVSGSWSRMRAMRNSKLHKLSVNEKSSLEMLTTEGKNNGTLSDNQDFVSNKEKTYKVPVRAIKKSLSDSNCTHYIDNIVKENKSVSKQPPIVGKLQNLTSPSLIGASVNYEKGTRNFKTSSVSSNVITRAKKDSFTNELLRKQTVSQDIDLLRNNRQAKQNSVFSVRNSVYENQNSVKKSTIQPIRSCCRNRVTERKSSVEKTNKINTESNYLSNKPDLLCHGVDNKNIFNKNERLISSGRKIHRDSPIPMTERSQSPVYQNIDTIVKHSYKTTEMIENEKKILDELTRAADEILQAVNGYTDEESFKFNTTDDDDELKKYKYGRKSSEVLETISESNSLKINKNDNKKMNLSQKGPERVRICQASSTSSLDSVGSEHRRSLSLKKEENKYENVTVEKTRTKSLQNSTQAAKTTRTRRLLQRASSKEALLHSNGSSSEDISAIRENARKQRVVRRTKTSSDGSVTASSIVRSKRTNLQTDSKNLKTIVEGRPKTINTNSTAKPEIHHKIVVSTIKSVSDKSNTRGKSKSETQHQHSVARSSRPTTARVRSVQRSDKQTATAVRAERIVTSGSNVLLKSQRTDRSMVKR